MHRVVVHPALPGLIAFNRRLDREGPAGWCEAALADRLDALLAIGSVDGAGPAAPIFGFSLARLAELTLLCAGAYADMAAFSLAGDLLVCPRRVDVHVKGRHRPVIKHRHARLSDTLAVSGSAGCRAVWLSTHTYPLVQREALLPELYRRLTECGFLSRDYLAGMARRLEQVAATLAFLSAWQIQDEHDLYRCLQQASAADRDLIRTRQCRFSPIHFYALGRDIQRLAAVPGPESQYLSAAVTGDFFSGRYANIDTTLATAQP